MRPAGAGPCLDLDEPRVIADVLSGQSIQFAVSDGLGLKTGYSGDAGLYFRGMPLGLLRVKNGRAFWSEG